MPRRTTHDDPQRDLSSLRVTKTLRSGQAGTKRHAILHGDQLVCVRHRIDLLRACRLVTVELVVDTQPITARGNMEVTVRIDPAAKPLRARLFACGARWDAIRKVWRMPESVARSLQLTHRIVRDTVYR